jgi:drug/metabolite transporter (DMT)-like permease
MTNWLLYAATVLIWGSTWYAVRLQLGVVAPEMSVAYRFLLAGAILLAWCLVRGERLAIGRRNHLFVAGQGLTLFCTNYVVFYHASAYLTTGLIAVLFSAMLLMNVANGAIFLGAPVERRTVIAGLIGLTGIVLLFWPELTALDLSSGATVGIGLSFVGALLASWGNMFSARNQRAGLSVLVSNALAMTYGGVLTLAYALVMGHGFVFDWRPAYVLSFLFLVVFGSIVAFGCYLTLLGRIGAARAAYAMVVFPVIALGISTWLEDYHWTALGALGVVLILCGNLLVLTRPAR